MKKIVAILMLIMYSLSVSGSVVQLHFCGSNLKSFSVNKTAQKTCCCPMTEDEPGSKIVKSVKNHCCSETSIALKLDLDQSYNNGLPQLETLQIAVLSNEPLRPVFEWALAADFELLVFPANAPPGGNWQQIPLYKLFNSIVYYG